MGPSSVKIEICNSLETGNYEGILLVVTPSHKCLATSNLHKEINEAIQIDPSLETEVAILPLSAGRRLIYSPTGNLDKDYDDVRCLQEAAINGTKRVLKAKFRRVLLVLEKNSEFSADGDLVILLGVLQTLYMPIQAREATPSKFPKLDTLGIFTENEERTKKLIRMAETFEYGRCVARDVGGADPERMAPFQIQRYVEETFSKTPIKINVIDDIKSIATEYPLFEAVNRAASVVPRHQGKIIYLEYEPPSEVKETLFVVGKGVTYDTGGADLKVGGVMSGMSRDKCGAAAVAGFMKIISDLKPSHLKVVAAMPVVRNSIGSNCYVPDEIITSRNGKTVRVGNTDAEGRMIMADVLCKMKEMAVDAVNPHLFTIATLTGHALLTVGKGYSIAMDNGPARNAGTSVKLQSEGHLIGDPFEISTIRREDFHFHKGKTEGEDILQCNTQPSSRTPRGHQGPAAFLILASGLDEHGSGSEKPLKYTHIDIAASCGEYPHPPSASPILALINTFVTKNM